MRFFFSFLIIVAIQVANAQDVAVLNSSTTAVEDAVIGSLVPNQNTNDERLHLLNWTVNGEQNTTRALVKFDLSTIPSNVEIIDAKLVLYYSSFPDQGLPEHAGENGFYIERIIEDWQEDQVVWNTQPSTTMDHRVYAPDSETPTQNYVVNVTDMVQDMKDNPSSSFGFLLKHGTESPYRMTLFASSDNEDLSVHQELIVTYNELVPTDDLSVKTNFWVYPNPTNSWVQIQSPSDMVIDGVIVRDALGRRMYEITKNVTAFEINEKGTYILEILSEGQHIFKRIVVQ